MLKIHGKICLKWSKNKGKCKKLNLQKIEIKNGMVMRSLLDHFHLFVK